MNGDLLNVGKELLGPTGGALALAFGAGCAATYTFLLTTTLKSLVGQVTEWKGLKNAADEKCEDMCRIKDERIKELEHQLLFETIGNNRQRSQLAASETYLVARGKLNPDGTAKPDDDEGAK